MKPSARVALIVALAATTGPTWASLPFYSPDYTFDSTTGTGYTFSPFFLGGSISPDGKTAGTFDYIESNVASHELIASWRGQVALPTPQLDSIHTSARAYDINRYGWTCGYTELTNSDMTSQAALWQPNGIRIDLPHLSSSFSGEPAFGSGNDMNDAGVAVGYASKSENDITKVRPVYWTSSREVVELANPLATPDDEWEGEGLSISSDGVIAGNTLIHGSTLRAMRWDLNGTAEVLPMTTNTGVTLAWTYARTLSDDGTIVGQGRVGTNGFVGVLWTPNGEAIELRNLSNVNIPNVEAYEINENHYSVGKAQGVAVRWSPDGEPLASDRLPDIPSGAGDRAYDINDFNFAVGRSQYGTIYERAILWTPSGDAIDMNSLIESNLGWSFVAARSITNTGWISGVGAFDPAGPLEAYSRPFSILVPFAGTYGMGDANFDVSIDFADLLIVAQNYGSETNGSFDVGDFNLDGSVDFTDLLAIAQHYGESISSLNVVGNLDFHADWQRAQAMVPEPGVVGALIGVGLLLRRRSRHPI